MIKLTSNSSNTVLQIARSFIIFFVALRSCFDFSFALIAFSSDTVLSVLIFFKSSSSLTSITNDSGDTLMLFDSLFEL